MKRRNFLIGSASSLISASSGHALAENQTLSAKAAQKGLIFGCAVRGQQLIQDKEFSTMVASEAGMLVHEFELKRGLVEPSPGRISFERAEPTVQFAEAHGLEMRGTPLVWYKSNPRWIDEALSGSALGSERILKDYADAVVGHYSGRFHSWDVVNEPVEPNDGRGDGMRANSPWFKAFGEDYIPLAFEFARAADPKALMMINDYNLEHASSGNEARRRAVLMLLERLKKRNVPIDGLGVQGHLKPYRDRLDQRALSRFLDEVQSMGLKIMITELDVSDREGPANETRRDADVAAVTRQFLDVVLDKHATIGVLTWGFSDRYSWLSEDRQQNRADGRVTRGLPLDTKLLRKPMWHEIASALDAAPPR